MTRLGWTASLIVLLGTFYSQIGYSIAKSMTVIPVPWNAQPGHIVTVLPHVGQKYSIKGERDPNLVSHFRISDQGEVHTTADVSSLAGEVVSLTVHHHTPARSWKQVLRIFVRTDISRFQFEGQPYNGHIPEKKPIGTPVQGLEQFYRALKSNLKSVKVNIVSGSKDLFGLKMEKDGFPVLVTKAIFDAHTQQKSTVILHIADSQATEAYVKINVHVLNKKYHVPKFNQPEYFASIPAGSDSSTTVLVVQASGSYDGVITYHMKENNDFSLDPNSGILYVAPYADLHPKTYELKVYAQDGYGLRSKPAAVRIQVSEPQVLLHRSRRAARPSRTFVVRFTDKGDLFTVASVPADSTERFEFKEPSPEMLTIHPTTGMLSLRQNHQWNTSWPQVMFTVNITRTNDSSYEDDLLVTMKLVNRGENDPIFKNEPRALRTTVPKWSRPGSVIYQLSAIDEDLGAQVEYKIESMDWKSMGRFTVDSDTGKVRTQGRLQFEEGYQYVLGVTARNIGAAIKTETPSQILYITGGDLNPQFYSDPFVINMKETKQPNTDIGQIRAKSFQDLPLRYDMQTEWNYQSGYFAIERNTGKVKLMGKNGNRLGYAFDPWQYRYKVTVTEEYSQKQSTVQLIINLVDENDNTPFFGPSVYVKHNVSEDIAPNTELMTVSATDIDSGANGEVTFSVDNELFEVTTDPNMKTGKLRVKKALDYDFLEDHMYEFALSATDHGSPNRTGTAKVRVWMKNVNDQKPVFHPPVQKVEVKEDARTGLLVHIVQASDPDGDRIAFRLTGQTGPFSINGETGHITLNRDMPKDKPEYTLTVEATDDGSCCPGDIRRNTATGQISVVVRGVNHPPRFDQCSSYAGQVLENRPPNTPVINVTATDDDVGAAGQLTYTVVVRRHIEEQNFNVSTIGHKVGEVRTMVKFNREVPPLGKTKVGVTVRAEDHGKPSLSALCFFFVTIIDVNDHRPEFDETIYKTVIRQTHGLNTKVIRVFAIDRDEGDNAVIDYSITTQDASCQNCFRMERTTGWIILAQNLPAELNRKTLKLTVSATDRGQPAQNTAAEVQIGVSESARLPPKWDKDYDNEVFTIKENSTADSIVAEMKTVGSTSVSYALENGKTPPQNSLDNFYQRNEANNSMSLRVYKGISYEITPKFILKLRASYLEADSQYRDVRVKVDLSDVNDEIPQFQGLDENGRYPASLFEDSSVGTSVLQVTATDDDGTSPNNKVTYKFDASRGTDHQSFTIDQNIGVIRTNAVMNRDIQSQYTMVVIAQDGAPSARPGVPAGQPNTAQVQVIIQVVGLSMNPPYFRQTSRVASVPEGSMFNTSVETYTATDPDPGTQNYLVYGWSKSEASVMPSLNKVEEFNSPQYGIVSGMNNHEFAVETDTGRIYVTGKLRYDTKRSYDLVYRVFDGLEENRTTVRINLQSRNLFPPVFNPLEITVNNVQEEDSSITDGNRRLIGTFTATDPDTSRGNGVAYSLAGPVFEANKNKLLIESDGKVYLRNPIDRDYPGGYADWVVNVAAKDEPNRPDFERKTGYGLLKIRPTDINDNAPKFDIKKLDGNVAENSGTGSPVVSVGSVDYDAGENARVTYGLVEVPTTAGGTPLFRIDPASGRIDTYVATLDREEQDKYTVVVRGRDNGSPNRMETNQTVYITIEDVNDNPPIFPQPKSYTVAIPEEQARGSFVVSVSASDKDIGKNAKRTYTVLSTQQADHFYADSIFSTGAGTIKVAKRIDFDTMANPQFTFQVTVTDPNPQHSDICSVIVNITDINDNAPEFSPDQVTRTISEDTAVGTQVARFNATDIDSGENKLFEYSIDYRNTDQHKWFGVGKTSGVVTIRNKLDRETIAVPKVHILAIDKGTPPMTGTATLTVSLTDINDNAPTLREDYKFVVPMTTRVGYQVGTIYATDKDTDANGPPFKMSLDCSKNDVCSSFNMDFYQDASGKGNDRGVIRTLKSSYSRSDQKYFYLPIIISDTPSSGQRSMTGTSTLTLTVEDSNANDQRPGVKEVVVYNYQGKFTDVSLGNVYAEDPDDWDRKDKAFSFTQAYPGFSLKDGNVMLQHGVKAGTHTLSVKVRDTVRGVEVTSKVVVHMTYIYEDAVMNSASVRLSGITAEEFIERSMTKEVGLRSPHDLFKNKVAALLSTKPENVDIFSVRDVTGKPKTVDVRYTAHGSPNYHPSKMDGLVWSNKADVEKAAGITIAMSPVDECLEETCWDAGCTNDLVVKETALLVNTNTTSLVGVDAETKASCKCDARDFSKALKCDRTSCLNGGTCVPTFNAYKCQCKEGFTGPRCQQTRHSFKGNGWAWYAPLGQCDDAKTSFQFMTQQLTSMMLYNGPITDSPALGVKDFISVELVGGYPKVRVNLGSGEVQLSIDGKNAQGQTKLQPMADDKWHTIEIFKEGKTIRMVADYCKSSDIDESILVSAEDRKSCEDVKESPGDNFLLNVYTPLQLGGRSNTAIKYPPGLTTEGFRGCIKNLIHNGIMYDLHIGQVGQHLNTEDGCPAEDAACGLSDPQGPKCKGNSTCIGSLDSTDPVCVCNAGFYGDNCDKDAPVKDYEQNSYMEWQLKPVFASQLSSRESSLHVMFRTRRTQGVVFTAASQNKMEHFKLEIQNTNLQVRYDLGSNDHFVRLSSVNVSDGEWHVATVKRYTNQVILQVDSGEGRYYGESARSNKHRQLTIHNKEIFGGANVFYKRYSNEAIISDDFIESCVRDVRYDQKWFPMKKSETAESTASQLIQDINTKDDCTSAACVGVTCPNPTTCFDAWRHPICQCPWYMKPAAAPHHCLNVTDCSIKQCVNGYCVMAGSPKSWKCICFENWEGLRCDRKASPIIEPLVAVSGGAIAAIVVSIIVILLLILLFIFVSRTRDKDYLLTIDPDEEVRENVAYYDEEGAGEDDMTAFDISRLRKPVNDNSPRDSMIKGPIDEDVGRQNAMPLGGADPTLEPLSKRPGHIGPDGTPFPNIGDFIDDRLNDADDDPNAPPYDSVREYQYEGGGSTAGSLSSLQSSSSGSQNYDYLNDWGPRFQKLADLYGGGGEDDEDTSSV